MALESISQGSSKTDSVVNIEPIVTPRMSKEALRVRLRHSLRFFFQNLGLWGTFSRLKSAYFIVMQYFRFIILT